MRAEGGQRPAVALTKRQEPLLQPTASQAKVRAEGGQLSAAALPICGKSRLCSRLLAKLRQGLRPGGGQLPSLCGDSRLCSLLLAKLRRGPKVGSDQLPPSHSGESRLCSRPLAKLRRELKAGSEAATLTKRRRRPLQPTANQTDARAKAGSCCPHSAAFRAL